MIKISSSDFGREPDRYQDLALEEPVLVTHDGRDPVVVISEREFRRLKRRDRTVLSIEDFTPDEVDAICAAQPSPEAEAFNHELHTEG